MPNSQAKDLSYLDYKMKSHRVELCLLKKCIKKNILDKLPKYLYGFSSLFWILATIIVISFKNEISAYIRLIFPYLKPANTLLNCHLATFIALCALIIFCGYKFLKVQKNTRRIEIWLICLALCIIIFDIVLFEPVAAISPVGILLLFVALICIISLVVEIFKILKFFKTEKVNSELGLIITPKEHYSDGREVCVDAICDLIRKTLNKKVCDSFAIGICGRWGSGKTTALKSIKFHLKKEYEIVELSPWQSNTSDGLIADFFATLANTLFPYDKKLRNKIHEYANLLIEFGTNSSVGASIKLFQNCISNNVPINALRQEIEDAIEHNNLKIIVLIDDIDRLNGAELFEVLKLVRNTADFKNIAYVLTYDRQYIVEALNDKIVSRADEYLEKIFTAEVTLPAHEHYLVLQVLFDELKKHFGSNNALWLQIYNCIIKNKLGSSYKLNQHIKSYRSAIRFANMLIIDINMLLRNRADSQNINFYEFFDLEVLKYFYPADYEQLQYYPESVLCLSRDKKTSRLYFALYKIETKNEYEVKSLKSEKAKAIVYDLFNRSRNSNTDDTSIIYESNFYNYFALRVVKTEISQSEFYEPIRNEDLVLPIQSYSI
jgi:hypothetical protein